MYIHAWKGKADKRARRKKLPKGRQQEIENKMNFKGKSK